MIQETKKIGGLIDEGGQITLGALLPHECAATTPMAATASRCSCVRRNGECLNALLERLDGKAIEAELLHHSMVVTYQHTMPTGILVGGDNSSMSVLEKLTRPALEN